MSRRRFATLTLVLFSLLLLAIPVVLVQSQTFGSGWTSAFWNNPTLQGAPIVSEVLPNGVNFNWGLGSPHPSINADNWSARFASRQLFNAGVYDFVVRFDDGVRIFIDEMLVLDLFVNVGERTQQFQHTFTAGTHELRVEYVDYSDQAVLQFQWSQTGAGQIPPGFPTPFGTPFPTFGPSPTFIPLGPQASVAGVRGLALRTGPYLGASFITTLTPGTSYTVLGRNRDEGIYNWYLLQVGSRTGWASGRYLSITTPPIPIAITPFPGTEPAPTQDPALIIDINAIPLMGSVFDEIDETPDIGARAITRAVMNVRRRPSTRSEVIGSIPWGGVAPLIGRTVQAGENQWLHVRYFDEAGNTILGWIDERWVTIQGEIFNVPIR